MKKYIQEFRYNFNLALPVILGMVGHTLVGVVDNIFVGQLGSTELAAVSLGNSFDRRVNRKIKIRYYAETHWETPQRFTKLFLYSVQLCEPLRTSV